MRLVAVFLLFGGVAVGWAFIVVLVDFLHRLFGVDNEERWE